MLNFEVTCNKFCNSDDIVEFLSNKFKDNQEPVYYFKGIDEERLMAAREKSKIRKVCPIKGSSNFQVMVFRPNNDIIRASNRLCLCDQCKVEYGSCDNFNDYVM